MDMTLENKGTCIPLEPKKVLLSQRLKKKQGPNSEKQASQTHKRSPDALLSLSLLSPFGPHSRFLPSPRGQNFWDSCLINHYWAVI
jgi:hypothetical protein